ncbi:hypothetical protein [Streptomyces sp. SID161]|uniref:hypothetical protein n=1 Tax=Streptomyces sp. SID161 TaxID=2690251 RepID=UPI0013681E91|nr:hypothetical protein [Streptomyces sp. SID161]MYW49624.1 hypothetical protein [Streptomyces sp. SID161]
MPRDELTQTKAHLRLAQQHAHQADAERAELEAQLHSAKAETARANARAARAHVEAVTAQAALAEVRRLCDMTIADSVRVQAVQQARDTIAVIDSITAGEPLSGDAAWHSVWLHGDWRWLTKNMTTPEREHAADAVARYGTYLDTIDGADRSEDPEGLRWWRD